MKKAKFRLCLFYILSFFIFLIPSKVFAYNIWFSGNGSMYPGETITINLYVPSGITSISGNLSFDQSYLEYVSGDLVYGGYQGGVNPGNSYRVSGVSANPTGGDTNVFSFTFRAKRTGTTQVSLTNAKISTTEGNINAEIAGKTINIVNPPSGNNNLSSLAVDPGGINFNKDNTYYYVNVGASTTYVNINGSVEDGTASITNGLGGRNLNYGENHIYVTVRAQNGNEKSYHIVVNRKDDRSSNNNLKSLNISNGKVNPGFSKNNLNYSIDVPYAVSKLNIDAVAEDAKAKVNISNNNLISEETVDVKVTVTAENGSSKSYTIHATRGKDPNKKLSNNNYLTSLTASNGQLSPAFNKEQEKYIIYLPYEVDSISFDTSVEDTRYATIKKEGNDKLNVGTNLFKFIVTAEDNSTKVYMITVIRGKNLLESNLSSNVYLKDIKVKKGKLKQKFKKEKTYYTYTGGSIEAIPEDKDAIVTIIKGDNSTSILVESPSGEVGVYTLKKETIKFNFTFIIIMFVIIMLDLFIGYQIGKNNVKTKKPIDKPVIKKENKKNRKIKDEKK